MPGFEDIIKELGFAGNPVGAIASAAQKVLGIGAGIGELIGAGKDRRAAEDLEKKNPRPKFDIPQTAKDNQSLVDSETSTGGLSDTATIAYTNKSERDFNNAVRATLMTGGGPNDFGSLYDTQADAATNIALLNEEIRQKKIKAQIEQNDKMADWDVAEWQVNEYGPYADAMAKAEKLRDAARQRKANGLGMLGGVAGSVAKDTMFGKDVLPGAGGGMAGVGSRFGKQVGKIDSSQIIKSIISGAGRSSVKTPEQEILEQYGFDLNNGKAEGYY